MAEDDNKLLIIAWDGLDHELINKFNLEHVPLETMGKIDNNTGINTRSTSELYTSFITGETHTEHGVTGINKFNKTGKILESILPKNIRGLLPATNLIYNKLWDLTGADKRKYYKQDYNIDTLFDIINDSKAMFVPGYNPGFGWSANLKTHSLDELMYKDDALSEAEKTVNMMFDRRWDMFKQEFDREEHSLLMCHFHYPDYLQHFYGTKEISYEEDILKGLYLEIDQYAKKIKAWADLYGYDLMFFSDHGLPQDFEHNKQAFYSIQGDFDVSESEELRSEYGFDEGVPITMFFGEILEYFDIQAEATIHNN